LPASTVSIVIPCFNAERWLRESIESALAQTYPHVEIMVVDDGSTDGSLAVASSYGPKVQVITGTNRGCSAARNRGMAATGGKYIQFLDDDDYLLPRKIERQVRLLEAEGADIAYEDWRYQHHSARGKMHLGAVTVSGHHDDILTSLLGGWTVPPVAFLHTREVTTRVSGWDERFHQMDDVAYLIAAAMAGAKMT
jgi:glycosyltransferase involved in cell wall biosynthesis